MRDGVLVAGVIMAIVSIGFGFRKNPFGSDHDGEVARWIIGLGTGMGLTIAGLAVAVWPDDEPEDLVVVDSLLSTGDESDPADGDGARSADPARDDIEGNVDGSGEPTDASTTTSSAPVSGVSIADLGLEEFAEDCGVQDTVVVLGAAYPEAWGCASRSWTLTESWSEFDLGTRYSSFAGFVAVTDTSPAAAVMRVRVTVGDEVMFEGDLSVGDQVPLEFDVSGAVRVGFETDRIEGRDPAMAVLVGQLDGGDPSEVTAVGPEPGGQGVSIAELGLEEFAEDCGVQDTVVVLGAAYPEAWGCASRSWTLTESWSEFDLGTRYSSFAGFVAVTDTSPAAAVMRVRVTVGDEVVFEGDLSVGDQVPLEFEVSGAVRVGFETDRIEGRDPAMAVLVGELDGGGTSDVIASGPEPGGSGVSIADLGLEEYAEDCAVRDTAVVAGTPHPEAWGCASRSWTLTESWSEFDLGTRYSSFAGFVAVTDTSPAAAVMRVTITVDDTEVYSGDLSVGDQVPLEFDVSGAVRVGFETDRIEGRDPAMAVLVGELDP